MAGSSMKGECQLNTTECLLNAAISILDEVKRANQEYNWDPLTFAVTVVIGIIALFFASVTILQGLMAAGPGRHRCNYYALGPWASLTQTRFDWGELRFRNTAFTPILSLAAIGTDVWPDLSMGLRQMQLSRIDRANRGGRKNMSEYFPATWLALLTMVDADDTRLWGQKATGADYMPADLAAAPAFATMLNLVALACLAAYPGRANLRFDAETKLPVVRSSKFELAFRIHPVLGAFGAFQIYHTDTNVCGPKGPSRAPCSQFQVKLTLLYTCGHLASRFQVDDIDLNALLVTPLTDLPKRQCKRFADQLRKCKCKEEENKICCGMPDLNIMSWCHGSSTDEFYADCFSTSPAIVMSAVYNGFPPLAFPYDGLRIKWRISQLLPLSRLWCLGDESLYTLIDEGVEVLHTFFLPRETTTVPNLGDDPT